MALRCFVTYVVPSARSTRNRAKTSSQGIRIALRALLFLASFPVVALLASGTAQTEDARYRLSAYNHTRWTFEDGAPSGTGQMVQTPDGWLWFAASEGLFRFDGVTFERIPPPAGLGLERASVNAMLVARSGELWVSFKQPGGVAVFRDGSLHAIRIPRTIVLGPPMFQTPEGAIWFMADGYAKDRLFRLFHNKLEEADQRFALPAGQLWNTCLTADGTVWVVVRPASRPPLLAYLSPRSRRYQILPDHMDGVPSCATDPQGRLWIADKFSARLIVGADGKPLAKPVTLAEARNPGPVMIAFDAAGGLWSTTPSSGIYYIPRADQVQPNTNDRIQRFREKDGLSSDVTYGVFVDREKNIWVGSDTGVDRFHPASVFLEPGVLVEPGGGYDMIRSGDNLFFSDSKGVFQIASGGPRKTLGTEFAGICSDNEGGYWGVDSLRLVHYRRGRVEFLPNPEGVETFGTCGVDRLNRLWVATATLAIMWHDKLGWHALNPAVPRAKLPDLVVTPTGDIAFTSATELVRVSGDRAIITKLGPFKLGEIYWIAAGTRDMFVSGTDGLLRIRGNRLARVGWQRFPWASSLHGLVQTSRGETWLLKYQSVSKVSTAELDRAFVDPRATIARSFYDARDGMRSAQHFGYRGAQMVVGADGRIWFLNRFGLSFLDPRDLVRDNTPVPVVIRSLASGGTVFRDPVKLVLPPGSHALDIAFAGLNLGAPQRAKFRYRLEGVDDDWIDPGARRLASYTNLWPGKYRFRVIAANAAGVWDNKGAALEFEIRPTFFQSWPFYLLCAGVTLALLWLAYSLRMRAVAERIRARMNERLDERERIARELHDTLLQSVQGLIMRFSNIAQDIATIPPAHREMIDALDSADAIVIEGRDRVHALRQWSDARSLSDLIGRTAERLLRPERIDTHVVIEGSQREVYPAVADELLRITDEALFNIVRHAQARSVTIAIIFGTRALVVQIVDDGIGIAPAIVAQGGVVGHFGLIGMRERAAKIGGRLAITPGPDRGTQVEVTVGAGIAYADGSRPIWLAWRRRFAMERSDE